jgi:RND family efflux transporter MFP subunit
MNDVSKHAALRSRIVTGIVLAALAVSAIVFREPLIAWFTGKPLTSAPRSELRVQAGSWSLRASLDPDPPRTSGNTLTLQVSDAAGHAVEGAKVEVQYEMPAMGAMAAMKGSASVASQKAGRYRARFDLPMTGTWTLKTRVSTSGASATQDFTLTVGTPGLRLAGGSDAPAESGADAIDHYTCSMHPSVHQKTPGKCPICGMDLVPVTKEQQEQGVVTIPAARQQLIGVRTSPVMQGKMVRTLRAVGRLAYDESSLTEVSLKVRGWIVKLFVTNTGQRVARGETLFTLYSPELYNAQQDYLLATREQASGSNQIAALVEPARQRLHLLDFSDAQIDELARRGKPLENVAFTARESGFVIEKNVVEGAAVEPGMRLYRIASLDRVWIEADVYEADFAMVRVGQKATVTLDYLPGRSYEARVAYVYPYLNAEARTGRVRLELVNRKLELRPGMYANVLLQSDLGARLQVPASAIVYTGPRRLVFVDLGEGHFRPQEVQVGSQANGMYEVLSGLQAGDRVATSGVFLIAAEARISTAAKYWETTEAGDIGAREQPAQHETAPPSQAPHTARRSAPANDNAKSAAHDAEYTCPMHPEVKSSVPGKCPKCGMDLVRSAPGDAQ